MVDRLYYKDADVQLKDESPLISSDVIEKALRNIYHEKVDVTNGIEENLFKATWDVLNGAVDEVFGTVKFGDTDFGFVSELKYNNAVFSAFKTHRQQSDIARLLLDDKGKLKSFENFSRDTEPITGKYNQNWLATERNTAIIRARNAADFRRYQEDVDLFPNLKWLESTSAERRSEHVRFYGLIKPLIDPFWSIHYPGNLWECKCGITNTDELATGVTPKVDYKPDAGLGKNPAFTAELFSNTHPYMLMGYVGYEKLKPIVDKFISEYILKQPPAYSLYIDQYKKKVLSSPWHGANEFESNLRVAKLIADKTGNTVYMLPRLDPVNKTQAALRKKLLPPGVKEGKNPDFYIDGKIFDAKEIMKMKGNDFKAHRQSIENHIKKAKEQADHIILEINVNIPQETIESVVNNYLKRSKHKREIWIIKDGELLKIRSPE